MIYLDGAGAVLQELSLQAVRQSGRQAVSQSGSRTTRCRVPNGIHFPYNYYTIFFSNKANENQQKSTLAWR